MAGTWIIMYHNLPKKPEVKAITRETEAGDVRFTVGRLHSVWSWVDDVTEDGTMDAVLEDVDDEAGCVGFGRAMVNAGWLTVENDTLVFPNFGDHNGKTAKRRAMDAARKGLKRAMSANCPQIVRNDADKVRNTEQNNTVQDTAAQKKGDRSAPPDSFDWSDCPASLNTPAVHDALDEWFTYRRERKLAKWQARTIRTNLAKFELHGPAAFVAAVQESISNGWQGVFPERGGGGPDKQRLNNQNILDHDDDDPLEWLTQRNSQESEK